MRAKTRLALAAVGLSLAATVNPLPATAAYPTLEFYDWYDSDLACRQAGADGQLKLYWFDYACEKAEGRHKGKVGLYVRPNPAYEWSIAGP